MMVDSKLVLLDEVGAGVNRTLLKDLGSAILKLNKEKGYTFCMIEHDMDFISRMCILFPYLILELQNLNLLKVFY